MDVGVKLNVINKQEHLVNDHNSLKAGEVLTSAELKKVLKFVYGAAVIGGNGLVKIGRKKIRIHLPQAVKHIHHHKKIYITNHPAPSQYAPAYMPSAEGAVAVPTNIALPAVAKLMPINSVDVIEESVRVPGLAASGSKLLPLYRARGFYGPTHSELDEQDYEVPTSVLAPAQDARHAKRVKVVKVNEPPRKKVTQKAKPKRAPPRKPVPSHHDDEHPVSTFHEQFYSDVQDSGMIRKIKKPPRVEKIVDGNTEHIHTYSEEHIHKVVFDDEPNYSGIVGVEPTGAMSAYAPFIPLKNGQLLAMASNPYQTLAVTGSMGTPSQYEYAAYNPREVTHDHIFHDHGELPEEVDLTGDILSLPPKVSYNSQGLRIGAGQTNRVKSRYPQRSTKAPPSDYTYYESIYSPNQAKPTKASTAAPFYVHSHDESLSEFKPVSTYRFKEGISSKGRNKVPTYYGKPATDYRLKQQTNVPAPFSVSSKIIHDYTPSPQSYQAGASFGNGLSLYEDANPFVNFKDNVNNFEYDSYASPTNVHRVEGKSRNSVYGPNRKGAKSFSTQNVNFGTRGLQNFPDNFVNDAVLFGDHDGAPSALENVDSLDQSQFLGSVTPVAYTAKDSPRPYQYYTAIAVKTLSDDQLSEPDASNTNFQYAEAPTLTTTPVPFAVATTSSAQNYQTNQVSADSTSIRPQPDEKKENKKYATNDKNTSKSTSPQERHRAMKQIEPPTNVYKYRFHSSQKQGLNVISPSTERSKLRYGDKI
ncbi:unnamed protein product, partial [Iphiclides podalirius]